MSYDTLYLIALGAMIGLVAVLLMVGLPRGKRMMKTNERIATNQAKILALHERQAAALDRIAAALEQK